MNLVLSIPVTIRSVSSHNYFLPYFLVDSRTLIISKIWGDERFIDPSNLPQTRRHTKISRGQLRLNVTTW